MKNSNLLILLFVIYIFGYVTCYLISQKGDPAGELVRHQIKEDSLYNVIDNLHKMDSAKDDYMEKLEQAMFILKQDTAKINTTHAKNISAIHLLSPTDQVKLLSKNLSD